MFLKIKTFLERIDYHRDKLLAPFIIKCWPRFITPNHLTYLRIVLAFIIAWMLLIGFYAKIWLIPLLIVGALLDLFDGSIARVLNKVTDLGTILDPIADRLLILPIAVFSLLNHYFWLLLVLLIPEIYNAFLVLYCKTRNLNIVVNIFGKTKMVLECVAFIAIFVFNFPRRPSIFPIFLLYLAILFLVTDLIIKTTLAKTKNVKAI